MDEDGGNAANGVGWDGGEDNDGEDTHSRDLEHHTSIPTTCPILRSVR